MNNIKIEAIRKRLCPNPPQQCDMQLMDDKSVASFEHLDIENDENLKTFRELRDTALTIQLDTNST